MPRELVTPRNSLQQLYEASFRSNDASTESNDASTECNDASVESNDASPRRREKDVNGSSGDDTAVHSPDVAYERISLGIRTLFSARNKPMVKQGVCAGDFGLFLLSGTCKEYIGSD